MAQGQLQPVLRYLRRVLDPEREAAASDAQLLDRFLTSHDETAFEVLVGRHAGMVWGVCRRVVQDVQAAEDAFQATFLVLVRKARTIGKREAVGSWLHRVASRIAVRARGSQARRAGREQAGFDLQEVAAPASEPPDEEVARILAEEVSRLPEKYRVPVVLCYLEGQAYEETARQLGCPKGTLSTRLTAARNLLRTRLARRGLALSAGALAGELSAHAAAAVLVQTAITAGILSAAGNAAGNLSAPAVALAQGVLNTMFMTKTTIAVVLLLVLGLFSGVGVLGHHLLAADGEKQCPRPRPPRPWPAHEMDPLQREDARLKARLDRIEKEIERLRQDLVRQGRFADLRWRFEKGKPFFQEVTTVTEQTMKVQNQDVKQRQVQTFVFRWTPLEQDAARNWMFRLKIEDMVMEIDIGQQKIAYDSTRGKDAGNNPLGEFFNALKGFEFTITLNTRTMNVTKVEGRQEFLAKFGKANPQLKGLLEQILSTNVLKAMAEQSFAAIPGKVVARGDTWQRESISDMGPIGKYEITETYTYAGKEGKLDRIKVDLAIKYKAPGQSDAAAQGLPFKITSANLASNRASGVVLFDPEKGWISRSDIKLDLSGNLSIEIGGQQTAVELSQTQKSTVKAINAPVPRSPPLQGNKASTPRP